MAQYFFSRDVKVYAHVPALTATPTVKDMYYELPVLDGFSFSQATNASEITLNQAQAIDGTSIRGRQMFNDSYAPAEFSFSTYMSPFTHDASDSHATKGTNGSGSSTDNTHCEVSEALWAMFFAKTLQQGMATDGTSYRSIVPGTSNTATIGVFDLYFIFGGAKIAEGSGRPAAAYSHASGAQMIYKIEDCSMNEASIDFDLDGIATVAWSGMGKIISEETGLDLSTSTTLVTEGVTNTSGFIRNRLSDLTISPNDSTLNGGTDYVLTLTGGNITMSNNLTYLTPETLGIVNKPLGHVTGTRTIGGNLTCYLDNDSNASAELFEDLLEATTDIQNSVELKFDIGASGTPHLLLDFGTCHLEVPTHSIDDVISLETNFHALPLTLGGTNEITTFNFVGKDISS